MSAKPKLKGSRTFRGARTFACHRRHFGADAWLAMPKDFARSRRLFLYGFLIAASLHNFTRRTDGYSLLGICMAAASGSNTPPPTSTCRPAGFPSGWNRYLGPGGVGARFFSNGPSPQSSLTSLWRGAELGH